MGFVLFKNLAASASRCEAGIKTRKRDLASARAYIIDGVKEDGQSLDRVAGVYNVIITPSDNKYMYKKICRRPSLIHYY